MSPSDIEARPKQKIERREESTRPGAYFHPAVDIFEAADELVLLADMPGVSPDSIDVNLEGDQLTIEGRIKPEDYEGLTPLHVEYGVGGFWRRFPVGEAIAREGTTAPLKGGVLARHRPKADPARG